MKFLSTITNNETTLENSYERLSAICSFTIISRLPNSYFWNNDAN